jgi:hypothetical protein
MRGRSRFKPHRYRTEKTRALTRRVDVLEAERRRLEVLLGEACRYGAHHTGCSPRSLLEVFAETQRINLDRPAWVEDRDRKKLMHLLDLLVRRGEAVA